MPFYSIVHNCTSLIMLLVPYTPELSELARGDLFFFFLEYPSFLRVVHGTSSFMLTDTEL